MPKCSGAMEVFSRVSGYHRPIKNWNRGKQEEFKDRKTYKLKGRDENTTQMGMEAGHSGSPGLGAGEAAEANTDQEAARLG